MRCRVEPVDAPQGKIEDGDKRKQQALKLALWAAMRRLRDRFADEPFCTVAADPRAIDWGFIDTRYQREVVLGFCKETPLWQPAFGHGSKKRQSRYNPPEKTVLTSDGNIYAKLLPGLTKLQIATKAIHNYTWHIHTDTLKELVHGGFLLDAESPGSIACFEGDNRRTHYTYARHVTAEIQVEKIPGVLTWTERRGSKANHYLDATYLALACCSYLEMKSQYESIRIDAESEVKTVHRGGGFRPNRNRRRAHIKQF